VPTRAAAAAGLPCGSFGLAGSNNVETARAVGGEG
jgi:hypothetical protein